MKIGAVNFLNAYPLYWSLENKAGIELIKDIPSKLADSLSKREMDTAIISSIEFFKHRNEMDFFPDLCIAANGQVESIRLFFNGNTRVLDFRNWVNQKEKIRIYYDVATRSSLAMLKVLCDHYENLSNFKFIEIYPPYEVKIHKLENNEAVLLIGDSALRLKNLVSIDLGQLYKDTFNKSFVYAIWVYPKGSESMQIRELLRTAYVTGRNHFENLLMDAVKLFGFSYEYTKLYLRDIIQYEFTEELKNDMVFFFEKYHTLEQKLN